jgi:hypothetical protein
VTSESKIEEPGMEAVRCYISLYITVQQVHCGIVHENNFIMHSMIAVENEKKKNVHVR